MLTWTRRHAAVGSWNDITRHLEHLALVIKRAAEDGSLCFSVASVPYCPINGSLLLQGVQICPAPRVLSYDGSRCGTSFYNNSSTQRPCRV